jgi:hypothetical protein
MVNEPFEPIKSIKPFKSFKAIKPFKSFKPFKMFEHLRKEGATGYPLAGVPVNNAVVSR